MGRIEMPGAMPAELAERLSDRPYRPRRVDADAEYDRHVERGLEAAAKVTDAAFDLLLRDFKPEPLTEYERLEKLLAYHRGLAMFNDTASSIGPKALRPQARELRARHGVACKALRRRIERMVRRGQA